MKQHLIRSTTCLWLLSACVWGQSFTAGDYSLLMLGDVNLGREVGQRIFSGDTAFPFQRLSSLLSRADLVSVNLESPLTDQGGETRHPSDGYRFCGPRSAAHSLVQAGIAVAVTSNNHAYDYGRRGLLETLSALRESEIVPVGTRADGTGGDFPVLTTVNGLTIGFVAYTEFVNAAGRWSDMISVFDRRRAVREIRRLRKQADVIVAQYHGGSEYTEGPPAGTLRNLRALASAGADIVIGHHPHVPQGVGQSAGALILYSLGNCVFYQPQLYWTQVGVAACLHVSREPAAGVLRMVHLIPFRAGLQPTMDLASADIDSLAHRFARSSPVPLRREGSSFIVRTYDNSTF